MARYLLAFCMAAVVAGAGARADEYDSTPLFARGAWSVEHTYDTVDGGSWCSAETFNRDDQWFSVVAYDNGGAAVFVGDPRWRLRERAVRYRIDIDYSRWEIDGSAAGGSVSVFLNRNAGAGEFLGQLMDGSAVAVYSDTGRRLAAFSLNGSRAALGALFECWTRIELSDPFTAASDPF